MHYTKNSINIFKLNGTSVGAGLTTIGLAGAGVSVCVLSSLVSKRVFVRKNYPLIIKRLLITSSSKQVKVDLSTFSKNTTLFMPKLFYNIQKRYIITGLFLTGLQKSITKTAQFQEQQRILLNKAIFLKYCEHFKKHTLTQLLDDAFFIKMMHDHIHKVPTLYSRAFQLALEVTYSKRPFTQQMLQKQYEDDFIVSDIFNVNNGLCDQSTIFTAISMKIVTNYFNLDEKDVVVTTTPLYLTKEKITENLKNVMDYNKKMTDNTAPDVIIKGRPFDFKDTKELTFNKNHIYILDEAFFTEKGSRLLYKLQQSLEGSLKQKLNKDLELFSIDFLKILKTQKDLNINERLENINRYLLKSNIPKDFKSPFIILKKKSNFEDLISVEEEKKIIENISLEQGHLDFLKSKKTIESILNSYRDQNLKEKIIEATKSSIRFDNYKEEID